MRARILPLSVILVLLAVGPTIAQLQAQTLISVAGPNTYPSGLNVGQPLAVSWKQSRGFTGLTIYASIMGVNTQTATAYLTTQIGPGTTTASEIAHTTVVFPGWNNYTQLAMFTINSLPAGTYYLTLSANGGGSCTPQTNCSPGAWAGSLSSSVTSTSGVAANGSYYTPSELGIAAYPPASSFSQDLRGGFGLLFNVHTCSSSPTFAEVVANGVAWPTVTPGGAGGISTYFVPGCGRTLDQAAQLGNYNHFNWVQVITEHDGLAACKSHDVDWPYFPSTNVGILYCTGVVNLLTENHTSPNDPLLDVFPNVPFFDVPAGGFAYQVYDCSLANLTVCSFPVRDSLPWYWDEQYTENGLLAQGGTLTEIKSWTALPPTRLAFTDMPSCNQILGPSPCIIRFTTTLVGVKNKDGSGGDALNFAACQTGVSLSCTNNIGTGFDWHAVGQSLTVDGRLQNFQPDPDTAVFFDGFKLPGAAGFTQPELELFAKSGIHIRDENGITIPVITDIEPGESPNSINAQNQGKIPVAIISTPNFNAPDQVDQGSLTFGHTGDEASLAFCQAEDVNGDGLLDLVCHFYTQKTDFQTGDTEGILKGKTLAGTELYGKGSVSVVFPQ